MGHGPDLKSSAVLYFLYRSFVNEAFVDMPKMLSGDSARLFISISTVFTIPIEESLSSILSCFLLRLLISFA